VGYHVLRDGQILGSISVCGSFEKKHKDVSLVEEERHVIMSMCKRVYEMPSEWGCLGVGESPTEPFEKFFLKHQSNGWWDGLEICSANKPPLVIDDRGQVYEEILPGVQLHRRDLEDTHDYNI